MTDDVKERFALLWKRSREDAGKSQEYMAKALGVSKKTVQNWECGYSSPSQEVGFMWFKVLNLQPLPYYLQILYPVQFDGFASDDDQKVEEALIACVHGMTPDARRKALYWVKGDHGSSPLCVLEMVVAHLQSPLRSRLNIAQSIETNYLLAKAQKQIRHPSEVQPNETLLHHAITRGIDAVIKGCDEYTSIL